MATTSCHSEGSTATHFDYECLGLADVGTGGSTYEDLLQTTTNDDNDEDDSRAGSSTSAYLEPVSSDETSLSIAHTYDNQVSIGQDLSSVSRIPIGRQDRSQQQADINIPIYQQNNRKVPVGSHPSHNVISQIYSSANQPQTSAETTLYSSAEVDSEAYNSDIITSTNSVVQATESTSSTPLSKLYGTSTLSGRRYVILVLVIVGVVLAGVLSPAVMIASALLGGTTHSSEAAAVHANTTNTRIIKPFGPQLKRLMTLQYDHSTTLPTLPHDCNIMSVQDNSVLCGSSDIWNVLTGSKLAVIHVIRLGNSGSKQGALQTLRYEKQGPVLAAQWLDADTIVMATFRSVLSIVLPSGEIRSTYNLSLASLSVSSDGTIYGICDIQSGVAISTDKGAKWTIQLQYRKSTWTMFNAVCVKSSDHTVVFWVLEKYYTHSRLMIYTENTHENGAVTTSEREIWRTSTDNVIAGYGNVKLPWRLVYDGISAVFVLDCERITLRVFNVELNGDFKTEFQLPSDFFVTYELQTPFALATDFERNFVHICYQGNRIATFNLTYK